MKFQMFFHQNALQKTPRVSRKSRIFVPCFGCMVGVGLVMMLFELQLPATSSRKAVLFARIAPICVELVHRTHAMLS